MIRLAISVEGQTEEEFVKGVLEEHLRACGVDVTPVQVGSARNRWKGGNVSESALIAEMRLLSHNFDAVTSLVDFYGFRGKRDRTADELVADIREGLRGKLGPQARFDRVIPYVQVHEFEGLLFSRPEAFRSVPDATEDSVAELHGIRARFASPEDINDSASTAPSKRLRKALPRYRKAVDGPRVARRIGVTGIRRECARFNAWLAWLEALTDPKPRPKTDRPHVAVKSAHTPK